MIENGHNSEENNDLEHMFLDDIRARMATIADAIFRLEEQQERGTPIDPGLITSLLREFHTVKACADFDDISTLAHVAHNIEDLLEIFHKEHVEPERRHLDLLYTVVDFTLQVLAEFDIPEEDLIRDADDLIRRINEAMGDLSFIVNGMRDDTEMAGENSEYLAYHLDDLDSLPADILGLPGNACICESLDQTKKHLLELEHAGRNLTAAALAAVVPLKEVRSSLEERKASPALLALLDELIAVLNVATSADGKPDGCDLGILSDVIVVIRNCCANLLKGGNGELPGLDALRELISDIRWQLRVSLPGRPPLHTDEDESIVSLDKVEGTVCKIATRVAADLDKQVDIEFDTDSCNIPSHLLNKLNVVLIHLIRNAVDHGIESSDERVQSGKSPRGTLRFGAYVVQSVLTLSIADDGRGLQKKRILSRAMERGLVKDACESDVSRIVMNAGFSTAEMPTMYSGRGMGMHIVNQHVEELGGKLLVESTEGRGTTVRIEIPVKE